MNRKPTIRDNHRDRGQVALEYIGFLPFLLLVGLGGIQLGWTAYVTQQAETAARTAARVEARNPGEVRPPAGRRSDRVSARPRARSSTWRRCLTRSRRP